MVGLLLVGAVEMSVAATAVETEIEVGVVATVGAVVH